MCCNSITLVIWLKTQREKHQASGLSKVYMAAVASGGSDKRDTRFGRLFKVERNHVKGSGHRWRSFKGLALRSG